MWHVLAVFLRNHGWMTLKIYAKLKGHYTGNTPLFRLIMWPDMKRIHLGLCVTERTPYVGRTSGRTRPNGQLKLIPHPHPRLYTHRNTHTPPPPPHVHTKKATVKTEIPSAGYVSIHAACWDCETVGIMKQSRCLSMRKGWRPWSSQACEAI